MDFCRFFAGSSAKRAVAKAGKVSSHPPPFQTWTTTTVYIALVRHQHGGSPRARRASTTSISSSSSEPHPASEDASVPVTTKSALPPHSLLPTKMLLRSCLVSTVSSKPLLLNASLRLLTFLTSTKLALFNANKNPLIHAILKPTLYNHFCAGENGTEVTNTIQGLRSIGFKGVILTYAREIVVDANQEEKGKGMVEVQEGTAVADSSVTEAYSPDIDSWKDGVMQTVGLLGDSDFLALKLTGAGASVMTSLSETKTIPKQMSNALHEICDAALQHKVRILVDAEQQSVQPGIDAVAVDLMRKYNKSEQPIVHNTYQAYLKATPEVLHKHMEIAAAENFALGIKLVRGAYMASEPRHLINDTKEGTDMSYNNITEGLLQQSYKPFATNVPESTKFPKLGLFLATHNKESATYAYELLQERAKAGRPTINIQYGQLLGMADEVSCALLQLGRNASNGDDKASSVASPEVYKCLSWGPLEDCLSYLLRRARENKDAVSRSKSEYKAVWAELRRRIRASFSRS